MRSPARAFAWEFGQPHRWALIGLAGYAICAIQYPSMLSLRVMADLLSNRTPEISMEGLTLARYGHGFSGLRHTG